MGQLPAQPVGGNARCHFLARAFKSWGFPGSPSGKEPACQCRRHEGLRFDPWVGKIPWRRYGNPLQCPRLENPTDRGAGRLRSQRMGHHLGLSNRRRQGNTEPATFLERGQEKFHQNRNHIHFSAGQPPPQVSARAEEEKRPVTLSVGKSDGKIIHADPHSAQAKGWGEFNLQGSRRETCQPTWKCATPCQHPSFRSFSTGAAQAW